MKNIKDFLKKSRIVCRIYSVFLCVGHFVRYGTLYQRNYDYSAERKIVYIENPKVANNSIKSTLYEGEDEYDMLDGDIRTDIGGVMRKNQQRISGRLPEKMKSWFKFTFVRNPYSRLVSCYENKYHKDALKMDDRDLLFHDYLFGYMRQDKGFGNFIRKVVRIPDRFLDPHIAVQSQVIGKQIDWFGHIESMNEDFEWLRERYRLKPLEHFNVTRTRGRSWMDYYDLDTAWLVYKKYREDFERFGYADAYYELVQYIKKRTWRSKSF